MNRLLTAKTTATSGTPCWGQSYGYDRYANLSAINVPSGYSGCDNGPALSLSIDTTNNKITNANISYDAAGNLTASPVGYSYTWNAEGRMATAVAGGVTYTYTYNGDGQRVKKAAASASAHDKLYWYGLGGEVLAESDLSGTLTSEYIFMGATRIARRDVSSGNVYYFLGDRLGNARIVTNSTGGIVEESDYLPYGTERTITDSLDNNYKFTGHERDGESGLDHTLFRQNSSILGRWLSPDSRRGKVAQPQTWNRYAYGGNSPCNGVDPDGAATEWLFEEVLPAPGGTKADTDRYLRDMQRRYERQYASFSLLCQEGLAQAHPTQSLRDNVDVVNHAHWAESYLREAVQSEGVEGIPWEMLAAIGIRESNWEMYLPPDTKNKGIGLFQIEAGEGSSHPEISKEEARNPRTAAVAAAKILSGYRTELMKAHPNLTGQALLQATAAAYNFGTGNISGNPDTIDVGTAPGGAAGNYGISIMNMMTCFR